MRHTVANADGRTGEPMLSGEDDRPGTYMRGFHAGVYFAATGAHVSAPPFLDIVPIRFAVAEAEEHYHVPLLVSLGNYSTYRGS